MRALKIFSLAVLLGMISVTVWASLDANVWIGFKAVTAHRWGLATLADTDFAFYFVYLWMFYKEKSHFQRALWFLLVTTLGTIAIAIYIFIQFWKLPKGAGIEELLLAKKEAA